MCPRMKLWILALSNEPLSLVVDITDNTTLPSSHQHVASMETNSQSIQWHMLAVDVNNKISEHSSVLDEDLGLEDGNHGCSNKDGNSNCSGNNLCHSFSAPMHQMGIINME